MERPIKPIFLNFSFFFAIFSTLSHEYFSDRRTVVGFSRSHQFCEFGLGKRGKFWKHEVKIRDSLSPLCPSLAIPVPGCCSASSWDCWHRVPAADHFPVESETIYVPQSSNSHHLPRQVAPSMRKLPFPPVSPSAMHIERQIRILRILAELLATLFSACKIYKIIPTLTRNVV